jgi:hypothetical protein
MTCRPQRAFSTPLCVTLRCRRRRMQWPLIRLSARTAGRRRTQRDIEARPGGWSRLGSNQRPPACEAGALPLSYETVAERRMSTKISTRGLPGRMRRLPANSGAPSIAEKFVRARSGGLSSSFAPGDDLVRCARM